MQIQDHPAAALIPRDQPGAFKALKRIIPHNDIFFVDRFHQLDQFILSLAGHLQRAIRHKRLKKIELRAYQTGGKSHTALPPFQSIVKR